jgi:hypothetical protein
MPTPAMDLNQYAYQQALAQNVDPGLVSAFMSNETGGSANPATAVSNKGAIGPMQLMPDTARALGVDPNDPYQNIEGGVRYIGQLSKQFGGDPAKIAAAYNAGPTAEARALSRTGDNVHNPQTDAYVSKVKTAMANNQFDASDFQSTATDGAAQPSANKQAAQGFQFDAEDFAAPAKGAGAQTQATPASDNKSGAATGNLWQDLMSASKNPKYQGIGGSVQAMNDAFGAAVPWRTPGASTMSGLITGQNGIKNANGQTVNHPLAAPWVGGVANGLVDIPQGIDSLATLAVRKLPTWLGGNPNYTPDEMPLYGKAHNLVNQYTAAPTNVQDEIGSKVGTLGGQAVGSGARTVSGIVGNMMGGATADVADQTVGKNLNPYARTAIDMAAGIAGGAPVTRGINRLTNGVTNPEYQSILDTARRNNVPVKASDLSPGVKSAAIMTEKIPFGNIGTIPAARQQMTAVRTALNNQAEALRPADLPQGAAAADTDQYLANDLRTQYKNAQTANNAQYEAADNALKSVNAPPPDMSGIAQKATALSNQYPDAFKNIELDMKTQNMLKTLQAAGPQPGPSTVMVGGRPMDVSKLPPAMRAQIPGLSGTPGAQISFQDLSGLRTSIGDALNQAKNAAVSGGVSRDKVGMLSQLYKSVNDSMDSYLAQPQIPQQVRNAVAAAQNGFRQNVAPFRDNPAISKVVHSTPNELGYDPNAQGLHQTLFGTNKDQTSQLALNLLSPNGKQAAAYQAVKNATDKALNTATESGLNSGSATKKLNTEDDASLDNMTQVPGFQKAVQDTKNLLTIGGNASRTLAGEKSLTGYAMRHGGVLGPLAFANEFLPENMKGAAHIFVPAAVGASNAFNYADRNASKWMLSNPGPWSQAATGTGLMGAIQPNSGGN